MFDVHQQEQSMPTEITEQFKKIDNIDPFEFKDGIDTESHAYVYQNAFNQFRYENEVSRRQMAKFFTPFLSFYSTRST